MDQALGFQEISQTDSRFGEVGFQLERLAVGGFRDRISARAPRGVRQLKVEGGGVRFLTDRALKQVEGNRR